MRLRLQVAHDMRANHRRFQACVSEQLLDFANVRAIKQQVRGEAVPERMRSRVLGDARPADGPAHGVLKCLFIQAVAARLIEPPPNMDDWGLSDVVPSLGTDAKRWSGRGIRGEGDEERSTRIDVAFVPFDSQDWSATDFSDSQPEFFDDLAEPDDWTYVDIDVFEATF
jgi:hypothetical protein